MSTMIYLQKLNNAGTEENLRESIGFLFGKEVIILRSRKRGLIRILYCGKRIDLNVWKSWQDRFVPVCVIAKQYWMPTFLFSIFKRFL